MTEHFEVSYCDDTQSLNTTYHTHNYFEFYVIVAEHATMYIEKSLLSLQQGDVLLLMPGVRHHISLSKEETSCRRFVFTFQPAYFAQLLQSSPGCDYLLQKAEDKSYVLFHTDVFTRNAIYAKLWQLIEELHSNRFAKDSMLYNHISYLLLYLNRTAYEQSHALPAPSNKSLYEQLRSYIGDHIEEELTLEHLSSVFFVSKYHIAHIFKANFGLSIHQYILKKRLAMASDAIASRCSISDAQVLCGFKDYSSFYRAFRKEYGISPKEYQKLHTPSEF